MRPMLLALVAVLGTSLCHAAQAKAPCPNGGCHARQYYSAWTYNAALKQHERFYCYLPHANSPKYEYMHVVYAPRHGDNYAYYYDPAKRDFTFRLPMPAAGAPIAGAPESRAWEVKAPNGNWRPDLAVLLAPNDTGEPMLLLPGDFVLPDPQNAFGR